MAAQLPSEMISYWFDPASSSPVQKKVLVPQPKENEVLLKVLAAGLCHSDVGLFDHNDLIYRYLSANGSWCCGHEGAGEIVALGSSVPTTHPSFTIGTYAAVYGPNSCFGSDCIACSTGNENVCRKTFSYGLGTGGSWAEYMSVRADCIVPVPGTPSSVPPSVVAIATDAILTPYHALKHSCNIQPGQTVLIYGVGGLGLHAVSIVKNMLGARVVACDLRDSSLEQATTLGAEHVSKPDDLLAYLAEHKLVIDTAVDFVGIQKTFDACFAAIRPGGIIHVVGLMGKELNVLPMVTQIKNLTFRTSYWGFKSELTEILEAIASGKLKVLVEERPMSEVAKLLHDMHEGKIRNRTSIIPDALFAA
ncbi:alcohol dehydogenase [Irpex rosettiformis]|uniref:Alcohol dehydogenase n=1 Tax=Irpex rosettiformis TaxID=378272 RepID=A0ACB8UIQ3_9APHY|nr:alcohol dehydogenase [Irpex rosettiformis]